MSGLSVRVTSRVGFSINHNFGFRVIIWVINLFSGEVLEFRVGSGSDSFGPGYRVFGYPIIPYEHPVVLCKGKDLFKNSLFILY